MEDKYKEFNKKDIGKYTIEIRGIYRRKIFSQEYNSKLSLDEIEEIAQEKLIEILKLNNTTSGYSYIIFQNTPVIEKRSIAGKCAYELKKEGLLKE
jgi:hypothetical protein